MNVADYLVKFLHACGVRQFFGYPGSPLVPLLEALRKNSDVEWILMRHENSAALAAGAQARLTGCPAVCVATSGPGAANFVCGVVDAHLDRAPLIALTGLVPTYLQSHSEFQDLDQTRLFATMLGQSTTCVHTRQLPPLLRNAVGHAEQRQEAVQLAIPSDVLEAEVVPGDPLFSTDEGDIPRALSLMAPPAEALQVVAESIDSFERVVLVVGRRALGAGMPIGRLAERLGAPVITSLDAKGVVDESHANTLGVLGIFGFPAVSQTKDILENAELVVSFGVDTLKPFLTQGLNCQKRKLIQCEPNFLWVTHEYRRLRTLVGPLETIAAGLAERVRMRSSQTISALAAERQAFELQLKEPPIQSDYVDFPRFLAKLTEHLCAETTLVLDTGAHTLAVAQYLRLRHAQRTLVSSHLGTMGFSLPALIAAQLTRPEGKAVGICGDGGLSMVVGELATAVQYQLPIVLIVCENGVLQNVRAQQGIPFGTEFPSSDFEAIAKAFGAKAATIDGHTDPEAVLRAAMSERKLPFVIQLRCDPQSKPSLSKWQSEWMASDGC